MRMCTTGIISTYTGEMWSVQHRFKGKGTYYFRSTSQKKAGICISTLYDIAAVMDAAWVPGRTGPLSVLHPCVRTDCWRTPCYTLSTSCQSRPKPPHGFLLEAYSLSVGRLSYIEAVCRFQRLPGFSRSRHNIQGLCCPLRSSERVLVVIIGVSLWLFQHGLRKDCTGTTR